MGRAQLCGVAAQLPAVGQLEGTLYHANRPQCRDLGRAVCMAEISDRLPGVLVRKGMRPKPNTAGARAAVGITK